MPFARGEESRLSHVYRHVGIPARPSAPRKMSRWYLIQRETSKSRSNKPTRRDPNPPPKISPGRERTGSGGLLAACFTLAGEKEKASVLQRQGWGDVGCFGGPPRAWHEGEGSRGESRALPRHLGFAAGWFAKATAVPASACPRPRRTSPSGLHTLPFLFQVGKKINPSRSA